MHTVAIEIRALYIWAIPSAVIYTIV